MSELYGRVTLDVCPSNFFLFLGWNAQKWTKFHPSFRRLCPHYQKKETRELFNLGLSNLW